MKLRNFEIGNNKPLTLMGGMNVLESRDLAMQVAEDFKKVTDLLNRNAVHFDELGTISENELYINDKTKVTIDELTTSYKSWLNNYMSK